MKKVLALASLLCLASACAPAEQGAGNANLAATNANTATPQPTPAAVSEAELIALDRQILDALKAKNWDAFAALLADDQLSVWSDSVQDKAQSVEAVKKLELTDISTSEHRVVRFGPDAAVLTYTSVAKGSYDGRPMPGTPSRDSTVWVRRGGKWLAAFHQETTAAPSPAGSPTPGAGAEPGPAAAATPSASPASSPTASPAAAPASASDAERQLWDALKRKDWNAFAAFLTDDSIEVEPDGVYTKAQSVENVKRMDFSTAALSDFREVKLTPEATVVTYVVKGTGRDWPPNGMRHSTVWVNRGGRWQAAFHQGTVIER